MKIVFMGTPDFAATVLSALLGSRHEVALVFTQPDRAKDRGKKIQCSPVKEQAAVQQIPVLQPERLRDDETALAALKEAQPDIIVVAAYGQILPAAVLTLPRLGCVNVHASLLPKLRGASPIQMAIAGGEEETGVTIMQMAQGLDTGDILSARAMKIGALNAGELSDALAELGSALLLETLDKLEEGKITPVPQDESKATYAGLITKKDGQIDFSRPAAEIERKIRGFDPWPGAYCFCDGQMLKLWKAEAPGLATEEKDGTVLSAGKDGLKVACGGSVLIISELQAAGKKRMKASDYLRGHRIEAGSMLT